jgi:glutathione-independent formaldehyde dehydrogenase
MKTVVYKGPHDVNVEEVPDAKTEKPTDVLVKTPALTSAGPISICLKP